MIALELTGDSNFYKYDDYAGSHLCVLINCNLYDGTLLDLCLENDDGFAAWDTPEGTVTIEITREFICTEEEFNAFMHNFTPVAASDTPVYNGVIPTGDYVYLTDERQIPEEGFCIMETTDSEGDPIALPDWFTYNGTSCFGIETIPSYKCADLYYGDDYRNIPLNAGERITVTCELEVTEEQYNAFMQHFTPVAASDAPDTPTYNGYIPKGTYLFANEVEPMDGWFVIERDFIWFSTNIIDIRGAMMELYEGAADCYDLTGGESWTIGPGNTIEVLDDLEATETEFNEFIKVFTPQ